MQSLLNSGIFIYSLCYAFEAVIRYGFHLVGHDELIFARDVMLGVPLTLIFVQQLVRGQVSPAFKVYLLGYGNDSRQTGPLSSRILRNAALARTGRGAGHGPSV